MEGSIILQQRILLTLLCMTKMKLKPIFKEVVSFKLCFIIKEFREITWTSSFRNSSIKTAIGYNESSVVASAAAIVFSPKKPSWTYVVLTSPLGS